jgi:FHS family Na+ dependent glucose MFS transporter 1
MQFSKGTRGSITSFRSNLIARTAAYYLSFVCLGMISALLGPTLTALADNVHVALEAISILFTANSFGYLVGSSQGGRLYDRIAGNPVMAVMLLILSVLLALVPLSPTLWLLTVLMALIGAAQGALDAGGNLLLIWLHGAKSAPFMNGLHFFFGIGAFLSPIIISNAIDFSGSLNWAFWTLAIIMLPPAVFLFSVPSPEVRKPVKGTTGKTDKKVFLALMVIFFFAFVGAEASFGGWIFTFAKAINLSATSVAAYLTSIFWLGLTIGRLVSIPLANRFSHVQILFADALGCILSLLILIVGSGSQAVLWIGTFGFGFAVASVFPTTFSFVEEKLSLTGKLSGWFFIGSSVGAMLIPWVIGQLFEKIGPQVMMYALIITVFIGLSAFLIAIGLLRKNEKSVTVS